jgi:PAS domain S-box-containing protein
MELHPGQDKRQIPEGGLTALDPIRRALEENEDWYRDLVQHSRDLLCIHDLQGRLLSVNPAPARVLGYTVEELLQVPLREIIAPEFRTQFDAYLSQMEQAGEANGLMAVVTRTGERRIWQYHNTLRTDGVAAPIVRGMAHDITDQIKVQKALRQREGDLNRAQAVAHIGSWSYNILDHSVTLSAEAYRIVGLEPGSRMTPEMTMEVIHPDDHARVQSGWEAALGRGHYDLVHRVLVHGSVRWVQTKADIEFDGDGRPMAAVGTIQDITERKAAEESLREYESVVEGLQEMIAVVDRQYRYVIVNHALLSYRNMDRAHVVGRPAAELLGQEFFDSVVKEKVDLCFQGKIIQYETQYNYPKLGLRDLFVTYLPIEGPNGVDRVACVLHDITERKQGEEELRQHTALFNLAHDAIIVRDPQDRVVFWNRGAEDTYGWSAADALGQVAGDLLHTEFPVPLATIENLLHEQGKWEGELQHTRRDKQKIIVASRWSLLRDASGGRKAVLEINRDVTEQREAERQLRQAKERLVEEKLYLAQEIDTELGFGEIIGQSKALKAVMQEVGQVASSDATVLLLGETGSGKELVARAIHRLSGRQDSSFIKLNCASIPSGLLESELFGYEKGAFTSAVNRKIGRLELADKGTLFLDEIGEIPLVLQPKLLRVLQDQEFERLGGTQTLKVNFRLIAATNRNLSESVKQKEFRSDLYYRLNVFPIRVPPLRERREDIPLLVEHFVRRFSSRMKRSIASIPKKTMQAMVQWDWPGNVRELENFIEHSVILTQGSVLAAPIQELMVIPEAGASDNLRATAREHILRVLRESRGHLSGPNGAAARLGVPRSTLQAKLKQLGIEPQHYRD